MAVAHLMSDSYIGHILLALKVTWLCLGEFAIGFCGNAVSLDFRFAFLQTSGFF